MVMKKVGNTIAVLIVLSVVGGSLKIYGSVVGGSKSVFVDAMTSIANTLAIIFILKFFKAGMIPPDKDHHYGHHRIALGGPISMLMLYSFVAGLVILDIVNTLGKEYRVGYESPIYATLALIPYGLAIFISKRVHPIVVGYAGFTAIELIESAVSIVSSLGGIAISYMVDLVGSIGLTLYLFIELVRNFREVVEVVSDTVSHDVVEMVSETVKRYGLNVDRIRLRKVVENVYHGDVIVKVSSGTLVEEAHSIVDTVEKELRKSGIDVSIHIEPEDQET